jgi:hypothetical protein
MRVGLRGKTFWVYKIRTMSQDAEALTGPVWSPGMADPRITKFGRFLRKSHLDELPQLFNVLAGDMVLIGPRPERPEFTQFLAQEIPGYVGRLTVKPGITGMAQINLPPDTDLESVRRKLELDLDYICNSNFWIDIRILFCTALKVFGFPGHKLAKLFGLRRRPKGGLHAAYLGERASDRKAGDDHLPGEKVNQTRVDDGAVHLRPMAVQEVLSQVNGTSRGNGNGNGRAVELNRKTTTGTAEGNRHHDLATSAVAQNGHNQVGADTIVMAADGDTRVDQPNGQPSDTAAGRRIAARRRARTPS